jgi:hypothetical protein
MVGSASSLISFFMIFFSQEGHDKVPFFGGFQFQFSLSVITNLDIIISYCLCFNLVCTRAAAIERAINLR